MFLVITAICLFASWRIPRTDAKILINDDEIYELTPFGYWRSDCVHSINSMDSSNIINHKDHFFINDRKVPRCKYVHNATYISERISAANKMQNNVSEPANGWQAYVKQDMGGSVTGFSSNWIVPPLPLEPSTSEVLYTFIGLQNIDWVPPQPLPTQPFDIIQPVLQYGYESGKGGGPYWGVSCWYVTLSNDVIQSSLKKVAPGDLLFGAIDKIDSDSWLIAMVDLSSGFNTTMNVTHSILKSQPWVYVALEVYNIDNCLLRYPAQGSNVPFTNLNLRLNNANVSQMTWVLGKDGQDPPPCNSRVSTFSPNSVTITF